MTNRSHRDFRCPRFQSGFLPENGGIYDAEWIGGIFDASDQRFFVSVQHNVTGHGVVLKVTGWKNAK